MDLPGFDIGIGEVFPTIAREWLFPFSFDAYTTKTKGVAGGRS